MPRTNDLQAVRKILEADRAWSAFALADLEPDQQQYSEWHLPAEGGDAVLLLYRAFKTPVLFLYGVSAHLRPLLAEIGAERRIYPALKPAEMDLLFETGYTLTSEYRMLRMALEPARFPPPEIGDVVRLGPGDLEPLRELYEDGRPVGQSPPFFQPRMLEYGVYYAARNGSSLLAAAGTHVVSENQSVAAIGNVYTRRDSRGQGLATRLTAAVASELLDRNIRTIVLNVVSSNTGAIRIYERLGFVRYCEFREGVAVLP